MADDVIKLTLVNKSAETDNPQVVIATRNFAPGYDETLLAWRVISDLGQGDTHPFTFPLNVQISAEDSWGNYTPLQAAKNGQAFDMIQASSGDILQLSATPAKSPDEIVLRNKLPKGAVTANAYRDEHIASQVTDIPPGQDAAFEFRPEFLIGVARHVADGQVLTGALLDEISTRIDLVGIQSADIVWRGGGDGPDAAPYTFVLENVNQG